MVTVNIDPLSGMLATPQCPKTTEAVYVSGSEPVTFCPLHGGKGASTTVSGWDVSSTETVAPAQGYVPACSRAGPEPVRQLLRHRPHLPL